MKVIKTKEVFLETDIDAILADIKTQMMNPGSNMRMLILDNSDEHMEVTELMYFTKSPEHDSGDYGYKTHYRVETSSSDESIGFVAQQTSAWLTVGGCTDSLILGMVPLDNSKSNGRDYKVINCKGELR